MHNAFMCKSDFTHMQISVIDVEGKDKLIAYVILHNGVYHVYSRYGVDEAVMRRFLVMQDLDIEYEIVDRLYLLNRLHDVLVGWNLAFDLRMIVKEYAYLLSTYEFKVIDLYKQLMQLEGEAYSLGRYAWEHYGVSIHRYSEKYQPEKMYRYLKCIVDVYFTNKIYQEYKDKLNVETVFFSPYSYL